MPSRLRLHQNHDFTSASLRARKLSPLASGDDRTFDNSAVTGFNTIAENSSLNLNN
ncbi:hypothetical protein [Microcoleus sp. CAWBG58]|uniref:hypothetical protein n=1 Tax=Microcoleus sp. CAWBG58 TaxID=2841651 RepID=UPI0025CCCA08|nr:hypothetical protein [Microcoleus sp. CAWBG58]